MKTIFDLFESTCFRQVLLFNILHTVYHIDSIRDVKKTSQKLTNQDSVLTFNGFSPIRLKKQGWGCPFYTLRGHRYQGLFLGEIFRFALFFCQKNH